MHAGVGDLLAVDPDAEDDAAAAGRHAAESMPTIDAKRTAWPFRSIERSRSDMQRHSVRIRHAAERVDRRRGGGAPPRGRRPAQPRVRAAAGSPSR